MIAETVSQAATEAINRRLGINAELGIAVSADPEQLVAGRPVPIRAIVVRFRRPLRDVMIFISSQPEDVVRPLAEVAATAALTALDIPTSPDQHGQRGDFVIEDALEYDSTEDALEHFDALYLEATCGMDLPTGELQLVLGTGLLESANCFVNGSGDPFAEDAADLPVGTELELGDAIGVSDPSRNESGEGDIGIVTAENELGSSAHAAANTAAADTPGSPAAPADVDGFDAMLAAQEAAEAQAAAIVAGTTAQTARANVEAAALPNLTAAEATQRWTELLSGVEVELSAELGRTDLTLRDITSLATQSVLTLDQLVHEPVSVYVNGTRYATARLVVVDGEYGIEILEVVEQDVLVSTLAA
jgi:flagellar motor switch protein FliN/FliY